MLIMMSRSWSLLAVGRFLTSVRYWLMLMRLVGAVFDNKEGERIAGLVGNKKIAILQNHGVLSVGKLAIDEAAFWYVPLPCPEIVLMVGKSTLKCVVRPNYCTTQPSGIPTRWYTPERTRLHPPKQRLGLLKWVGSSSQLISRRRNGIPKVIINCDRTRPPEMLVVHMGI